MFAFLFSSLTCYETRYEITNVLFVGFLLFILLVNRDSVLKRKNANNMASRLHTSVSIGLVLSSRPFLFPKFRSSNTVDKNQDDNICFPRLQTNLDVFRFFRVDS